MAVAPEWAEIRNQCHQESQEDQTSLQARERRAGDGAINPLSHFRAEEEIAWLAGGQPEFHCWSWKSLTLDPLESSSWNS